jgi:hypothetical protein
MGRAGLPVVREPPSGPRLNDLDENVIQSVLELYRAFGGTAASPSLRPGSWDLAIGGKVLVELDEELHFNRYRKATLEPEWARSLPWHAEYTELCAKTESMCLEAGRWGKRWTNPSCEAMFGGADVPGQFGSLGAPRWKQRALYDAMKDGYAASRRGYRVARLSVHDKLSGVRLGAALEAGTDVDPTDLVALMESRTA